MRKSILLKSPVYFYIRRCNLIAENGFRVDMNSAKETLRKENKLSVFLMIISFFLFTNVLLAQQPACNLNGVLEVKRLRDGGQNFIINSETFRTVPGSVYRWEFKSNNSAATFVSQNGQPNMTINPGNKNGEFNIKLTIINPSETRGASKTCFCTKSVSIGNLTN